MVHPEKCSGCDLCGMYCPDFAIFGFKEAARARKLRVARLRRVAGGAEHDAKEATRCTLIRPAFLPARIFLMAITPAAKAHWPPGARFSAGYPITPSTEVVERFASRIPTVGGTFIQMEDELAASIAIQGAVWGGAKAFTVTSGPGFSLMMEHIGYAAMTETPCVFVDVQRGGPSTGLPTLPAQADMMQVRWGSHGDYEIIALCPNSPQECFDLTITGLQLLREISRARSSS